MFYLGGRGRELQEIGMHTGTTQDMKGSVSLGSEQRSRNLEILCFDLQKKLYCKHAQVLFSAGVIRISKEKQINPLYKN